MEGSAGRIGKDFQPLSMKDGDPCPSNSFLPKISPEIIQSQIDNFDSPLYARILKSID